jgi:hypothetical protein
MIAAISQELSGMPDEAGLHLKITPGPPFWWEIYRGSDQQWVERSQFGYLGEKEALQDGEAALAALLRRVRGKLTARSQPYLALFPARLTRLSDSAASGLPARFDYRTGGNASV